MNKNIVFICILLLIFARIIAQEEETTNLKTRPFQVTFVTPLGTNGIESPRITNKVSLNILAGYNGGVDGLEFGSFLNMNSNNVRGVQVSGFGSITDGTTDAIQVAGFMNINGGMANGLQAAGFTNVSHELKGVQISGFLNVAEDSEGVQAGGFLNAAGNFRGVQGAGFLNAADNYTGIQITGFINCSDNFKGIQAGGFMNAANDFKGIQIAGFLNSANKVRGLQVAGFINICDTIDGIPIAPVSVVKKGGYRKFEFWGNETFIMNTSFKIGIKQFYTIYTIGYLPGTSDFNTGLGVGAGTSIDIKGNNSLDIDVNSYFINKNFWKSREYNQLNLLRISFNHNITEHFSIFGGPTFNILVSDFSDTAEKISPSWAFKIRDRNHSTRGWFGFNMGMRF